MSPEGIALIITILLIIGLSIALAVVILMKPSCPSGGGGGGGNISCGSTGQVCCASCSTSNTNPCLPNLDGQSLTPKGFVLNGNTNLSSSNAFNVRTGQSQCVNEEPETGPYITLAAQSAVGTPEVWTFKASPSGGYFIQNASGSYIGIGGDPHGYSSNVFSTAGYVDPSKAIAFSVSKVPSIENNMYVLSVVGTANPVILTTYIDRGGFNSNCGDGYANVIGLYKVPSGEFPTLYPCSSNCGGQGNGTYNPYFILS